jgi:2-alkyl-3-oxoalkanoate reductase
MDDKLNVVTGATGLLGSSVVEQLVQRGRRVRAIARPSSDTSFLKQLGVELATVDLGEPSGLRSAFQGADIVYHCAARVSDWGSWSLFQQLIVDLTRNVFDACRDAGVGRLLHVSSSRVYGHPRGSAPITEEEPLGQHLWRVWDYYPRAKIETEKLCHAYPLPWTIVRPTWIYGLRDRNTLPRIIRTLQLGQAALIGSGDNPLNIVFASDVADGIIRAANSPEAVGQVFNLGAAETFTQRQFMDALSDGLGIGRLRKRVPYWLAFRVGFLVECVGKALRVQRRLRITRHGVSLLGASMSISSAKASKLLGWVPQVPPLEGLRRTVEWYFGSGSGFQS